MLFKNGQESNTTVGQQNSNCLKYFLNLYAEANGNLKPDHTIFLIADMVFEQQRGYHLT